MLDHTFDNLLKMLLLSALLFNFLYWTVSPLFVSLYYFLVTSWKTFERMMLLDNKSIIYMGRSLLQWNLTDMQRMKSWQLWELFYSDKRWLCQNAAYANMHWEFVANDGDAHQHIGVASCCWAGHENVILEKASEQRLTHVSWLLAEDLCVVQWHALLYVIALEFFNLIFSKWLRPHLEVLFVNNTFISNS